VHYVASLEEILCGITLVAITMAIHGFGMLLALFTAHALRNATGGAQSFHSGVGVLIVASWIIVLVHLAELLVWAAFLLWTGAMPSASTAYYFALMQYTTVGSSLNLPPEWRLLEGMLPIAGLMTFAWSTGVLFTLAQEFQSTQLSLIHNRRAARKSRKTEGTNDDQARR
jgi:hypothetical protein